MSIGGVPREILTLALVGLAGFVIGLWLRRDRRAKSIDVEGESTPSVIVRTVPQPKTEPMAQEAVATLAAASQAMQVRTQLPICPSCGARMEMRIFKERRIWICEEFPVCRGAQMVEESAQ